MGAAVGVVEKGKCFRGQSVIPHIDEREKAFGFFDAEDRVAWELHNPVAFNPPIVLFSLFVLYGLSGYLLYAWRKIKGQHTSVISTSTDEIEEKGLH